MESSVTLEEWTRFLATATHPVSGNVPVAREYFTTKTGSPDDMEKTMLTAHNVTWHARFEADQQLCSRECRDRGIRLVVEADIGI